MRAAPPGRLRAFPPADGAVQGAALAHGRGAWFVAPEGEAALAVRVDRAVLGVRCKPLSRREIEHTVAPRECGWTTPSWPSLARGGDLARTLTVEVDALDAPPRRLSLLVDDAPARTVCLAPNAPPAEGWLCGYRACASDPIAFAAHAARRLEGALALLRDLGAKRGHFTLSRRDDEPVRARLTLGAPLPDALWASTLRALVRGAACGLEVDVGWAALRVAPSARGGPGVNETSLCIERGAVSERRESTALRALEELLGDAPEALLQAWSAPRPEALWPRCVTRWEREAGVRALPLSPGWFRQTLRAPAGRAFMEGAWRDGALEGYHPRAQSFAAEVAPRGAAAGSARVRAFWRRTGGEPMQGGVA